MKKLGKKGERMKTKLRYFVTCGKNPYGSVFHSSKESAIRLALYAKAELPDADVVVWGEQPGHEPFEVWENGNSGDAA